MGWQLLTNAHRLNITTLDSLCANITRQLPTQSDLAIQAQVTDLPHRLYQAAVDALLDDLSQQVPWQAALQTLLHHFHTRFDLVQRLLVNMLARREHWLEIIVAARQRQNLRVLLEQHLRCLINDTVSELQQLCPTTYQTTLLGCIATPTVLHLT